MQSEWIRGDKAVRLAAEGRAQIFVFNAQRGWIEGTDATLRRAKMLLDQPTCATWFYGVRRESVIAKVCPSCGARLTRKEWEALSLLGEVVSSDETGTYRTEMRNCACGSTIAIETRETSNA